MWSIILIQIPWGSQHKHENPHLCIGTAMLDCRKHPKSQEIYIPTFEYILGSRNDASDVGLLSTGARLESKAK